MGSQNSNSPTNTKPFSLVVILFTMSNCLIKKKINLMAEGAVNLNPLKKDLFLYDCLSVSNLNAVIEAFDRIGHDKKYPFYRESANVLLFLTDKNKFLELSTLYDLNKFQLDETTLNLVKYIEHLRNKEVSLNEDDLDKLSLCIEIDELDTRLKCKIINSTNEDIYAIPSLLTSNTFELKETTKQKAYSIIHKLIPFPDENTPWEKILDFINDEESKNKILALKNWINELPENIRKNELKDKIQFSLSEYKESLKRHKISSKVSSFKTIVNAIPTAVSELLRLRFDKSIDAFLSIAEQEVNFNKYEERKKLMGKELAYIPLIEEKFKNYH